MYLSVIVNRNTLTMRLIEIFNLERDLFPASKVTFADYAGQTRIFVPEGLFIDSIGDPIDGRFYAFAEELQDKPVRSKHAYRPKPIVKTVMRSRRKR